ncbi:MAG: hypothetical protein IKT84_05145 [Bacteroidales bacterium]|nr:hypothetical protein [Bacteroidales bacterium]
MEHKLRKIYFTIVIVLAILAGAAAIVFAAGFDVKTTAADAGIHTFFGIAYWTCVIFAAIAILGMLGFALLQIIVNLKEQPKKVRGTLIGIAAFIVVFAVAYLLSSGTDLSQEFLTKTNTTEGLSKLIGAAAISVYIFAGGALLSIIYNEVTKKLK